MNILESYEILLFAGSIYGSIGYSHKFALLALLALLKLFSHSSICFLFT